jgi:hypothetical protein
MVCLRDLVLLLCWSSFSLLEAAKPVSKPGENFDDEFENDFEQFNQGLPAEDDEDNEDTVYYTNASGGTANAQAKSNDK